jgi:hypothetical protein
VLEWSKTWSEEERRKRFASSPPPEPPTTMTTIPSRLARLSTTSGSWSVARARSRSLYRDWYRGAPEIVQLYAVNFPASAVRAKVRQEFEKNAMVDDLETVDILLLKGHQEFQEVSRERGAVRVENARADSVP